MREGNSGPYAIPEIQESRPPPWLPRTHASADLGYPGFHPPRPCRSEEILSVASAKNGYSVGHPVPAETFSAQDTIHNRFVTGDALSELENIINQVFVRKAEQAAPISPYAFKMPSRVILNDSKRHAWFADLANPDIPLHKLGKSVPHGAKGHDLLDLLYTYKVSIPRAVWFLRVFGANETAGLRNKPSYNPTQYSVYWALLVTSYMKKLLADIALPSAPRAGLNIKQTFKGVLADADSRNRWISRFTYCLELLRKFYSEGLVDNTTFLAWLVQQMGTCNLAQAGFVSRLADNYLDGMLGSRALTRPFAEACLVKLLEIRSSTAGECLFDTERLIKTILQRICLALPDAFISPRTWMAHSELLRQVLTEDVLNNSTGHAESLIRDVHQTLLGDFFDIKKRNEAMLFCNLPTRGTARLGGVVADIQLLNSISNGTDLETIPFFDQITDYSPEFAEKLDTLLTWSVTPFQYGDHRPYAAVTLLRNWRDKVVEQATQRDSTSPDEFIHDQLFDWLDLSGAAGEPKSLRALALLLGELVKSELFLYTNYIQRLIARGEPGLSYNEETGSRHRTFLSWIPLHESTASLTNQRKVTLYGARARTTPEDANERRIRREIRALMPELFGGESRLCYTSTSALLADCPTLVTASRYEQVKTFQQWLLPILKKNIPSQMADEHIVVKLYGITVEIMAHSRCFDFILEITLFLMELSTTLILVAVITTIRRYSIVWTCMTATGTITTALFAVHQVWKTRGLQSRDLLTLLVELDDGRFLDTAIRDQVNVDIAAFTHALHPHTEQPENVPAALPEILLLANDLKPEAPSILANSLWYKYRTSHNWAWKVWDNAVASLRQIPMIIADEDGRRACALRYGNFLLHVDEHLPSGMDEQVLQWFLGPGKSEVIALGNDAWDIMTIVIHYLSVHGALKTSTILRGLVYPAWQLTSTASTEQFPEVYLRGANNLFELLVLREQGATEGTPPSDLLDIQRIRTLRQDVYREPHFSLLVASIPTLISIERNDIIAEDLRLASMTLRYALCELDDFRQATHRNLDAVRDAFERPLQEGGIQDDLGDAMVDALRLVLRESNNNLLDWQDLTCLLSPWQLGATAILFQYMLRQIGKQISQELTHQAASKKLDELTFKIFNHSMTSEEAYFFAQMTRGVDSSVTGKFINNGLRCITDILTGCITAKTEDITECVRRAGEVLRVLSFVTEPLRQEASMLPPLESRIQEEFFTSICGKFKDIESLFNSDGGISSAGYDLAQITHAVIFLSRLLQFYLGFRGSWSPAQKTAASNLSLTIFRLATLHSTGNAGDLVAFPLLMDTLYYLIDEIPSDPKAATFDPFCNYPKHSHYDLPIDIPSEYRHQLRSLLPYTPPNSTVATLVSAYYDATGSLVYGNPVLNRPWEWMENIEEPISPDLEEENKNECLKPRYVVKNSACLSLETFAARATGDGLAPKCEVARDEGNIRLFEDGLSAESVFKRDWRESRVVLDIGTHFGQARIRAEADEGGGTPGSNQPRGEKRSASRASPASSTRSRTSTQQSVSSSTSSRKQSLGQPSNHLPSSAVTEHLNLKMSSNTTMSADNSTKRKVTEIGDDEVEIVEGPVPLKKMKTRSSNAL